MEESLLHRDVESFIDRNQPPNQPLGVEDRFVDLRMNCLAKLLEASQAVHLASQAMLLATQVMDNFREANGDLNYNNY